MEGRVGEVQIDLNSHSNLVEVMCITVFLWQAHPIHPFFILLNRDEFHSRPTKPLAWWEDGEILGGRDGLAGGTWLACSRNGKFAFLTNVREIESLPLAKSRGDLPVSFLKGSKRPKDFAEELVKEADQYNGFNLIVADIPSKTMFYITNRLKEGSISIEVSPGMHVLTNASLDSPWPKAQRLGQNFRELVDKYGEDELPVADMVENLMMNTIKDDSDKLPGIRLPELEYQLSSIFVDTNTPSGRYGTRSISAISVKNSGDVNFYERYLEKDTWKEHNVEYKIEYS